MRTVTLWLVIIALLLMLIGAVIGAQFVRLGFDRTACAITTTENDVGWRDGSGQTHDYMQRCK